MDPKPTCHTVTMTVNGKTESIRLEGWTTLLDLLREGLRLSGTKKGCDHGQCGACTVLIDGERVLSCLTLGVSMEGRAITTIEGLGTEAGLHPLQSAFLKHDAFQCGFCTSGQIMSAAGLLIEGCPATREAVQEAMSGNLCRCGAYPNIVSAVVEVLTHGAV